MRTLRELKEVVSDPKVRIRAEYLDGNTRTVHEECLELLRIADEHRNLLLALSTWSDSLKSPLFGGEERP